MIVLQIEIDDGKDLIDIRATKYLKGDPTHPDADEEGFVLMPNINIVTKMTDLVGASRAYQASVTVLNATKSLALAALGIGRG